MKRAFCCAILCIALCASAKAITVEGVVVENSHACDMDGTCQFSVKTTDGTMTYFIYGWGMIPTTSKTNNIGPCLGAARELLPGQKVRAQAPDYTDTPLAFSSDHFYLCGKTAALTVLP